jgi:hypothetical protein
MDEKKKEKLIEWGIISIAAVLFAIPFGLWLVNLGFFGKIMLVGRSSFSPVMDRLFLLSIMFFVMYGVSYMNLNIKYRAAKVFGVVALVAILSVPAIQFDNLLVPPFAKPLEREAVNLWFLNFPSYAALSLSVGIPFSWQTFLTFGFFIIISAVTLWDIKIELASNWKQAINMWWVFEIVYAIFIWIIFRIIKVPMFPPLVV